MKSRRHRAKSPAKTRQMASSKSQINNGYAIITSACEAKLLSCVSTSSELDEDSIIQLQTGQLVQIRDELVGDNVCTIKLCEFYDENPAWVVNLYLLSMARVRRVTSDEIWPFVIAILDPQDRLKFVMDEKACDFILSLQESSLVAANGLAFGKNVIYDCIVRSIGLVPEIGPGYYFGLELLNLEHGISPQAETLEILQKYSPSHPNLSLILTANWLKPGKRAAQSNSRYSLNGLICGAKELSREWQLVPSRRSKRNTYKDENDHRRSLIVGSSESVLGGRDNYYATLPDDTYIPAVIPQEKKASATPTMSSSKSTSHLAKQDSGSSSTTSSGRLVELDAPGSQGAGLSNEEFARFVENHDRHTEKMHIGRSTQTPSHSNSGTLKKAKTSKTPLLPSSTMKPSTIMRLQDRDLIVIDRADINEATSHESDVIILDPPPSNIAVTTSTGPGDQQLIDLKDILGENWPKAAGEAACMLNNGDKAKSVLSSSAGYNSSSSSTGSSNHQTMRSARNKSANPLSHLLGSSGGGARNGSDKMRTLRSKGSSSTDSPLISFESDGEQHHKKKIAEQNSHIYDNTQQIPPPPPPRAATTSPDHEAYEPSPLTEIPGNNSLGVGSMVEVSNDVCDNLYGVIRWVGSVAYASGKSSIIVGVELEDDPGDQQLELSDGTYKGQRLFKCPPDRALFVDPNQCLRDRRFHDDVVPTSKASRSSATETKMFGQVDCPIIEGAVAPLSFVKSEDLENMCGKFKGIQGHHNSCYLDATLFAMFTFTSVFDSLLFRPPDDDDNDHYEEVQKVLREEIVNPLRKNLFVRADRVMKLRQLLDKLSSVTGLISEEKDPEEFLNSLLAQILRADPFLKLSSGLDAFYYQLFVEKDERLTLPSVQQLFEQSFLASDIKLKEVPSCLIIQMPRFGRAFKMYPRILPSQVLDVTDIIEDSPRQCTVCGKLAEYECRECFGMMQSGMGLESTAFCKNCLETVHSHVKRTHHKPTTLSVPQDFKIMADHCPVPRLFMELFAVVCIETSHYVAFVKAGSGQDAPWCFFDSMADRKGETNGYNIPEMVPVTDLPYWLSEEGARTIHETASNDKMLPEHAKRLMCDAYMCLYQSTDVMMYR